MPSDDYSGALAAQIDRAYAVGLSLHEISVVESLAVTPRCADRDGTGWIPPLLGAIIRSHPAARQIAIDARRADLDRRCADQRRAQIMRGHYNRRAARDRDSDRRITRG